MQASDWALAAGVLAAAVLVHLRDRLQARNLGILRVTASLLLLRLALGAVTQFVLRFSMAGLPFEASEAPAARGAAAAASAAFLVGLLASWWGVGRADTAQRATEVATRDQAKSEYARIPKAVGRLTQLALERGGTPLATVTGVAMLQIADIADGSSRRPFFTGNDVSYTLAAALTGLLLGVAVIAPSFGPERHWPARSAWVSVSGLAAVMLMTTVLLVADHPSAAELTGFGHPVLAGVCLGLAAGLLVSTAVVLLSGAVVTVSRSTLWTGVAVFVAVLSLTALLASAAASHGWTSYGPMPGAS